LKSNYRNKEGIKAKETLGAEKRMKGGVKKRGCKRKGIKRRKMIKGLAASAEA